MEPFDGVTLNDLNVSWMETMPELYRIHRQDEEKHISMYQQRNANLAALMTRDRESDMRELDKAWTAANPET